MEINRIEESCAANEIEATRLKHRNCVCLFYKEEACSAPRIRFEACRTCVRINTKLAVSSLFDKIKDLASKALNLQNIAPGPPLPPSLPPSGS